MDYRDLERSRIYRSKKKGNRYLRNKGEGIGRIYVYREDRVSTPSHTIVGKITKGIQLMDIAEKGDKITIQTLPKRIMTLSMTQKEAKEFLEISWN